MKQKGFVFVETIVVIVILSLGLVMVYQSFLNVLTNNKRRASYNDIAYIYRTYYIEDFISSLNIEGYLDYYLGEEVRDAATNAYVSGGKKLVTFSCDNPILYNIDVNVTNASDLVRELPQAEKDKKSFCQSLLNKYNVKNLYITNYNVNDIKKCTTRSGKIVDACDPNKSDNRIKFDALYTMSSTMIYYLRTLNGTEENTYRLIVEYEENITDPENTTSKINIGGTMQCPYSYSEVDGKCQKTIPKRYYSNVSLVKKEYHG